jgi:hypothetical protein
MHMKKAPLIIAFILVVLISSVNSAYSCSLKPNFHPTLKEADSIFVTSGPADDPRYTNLEDYIPLFHKEAGASCGSTTYVAKFFLVQVAIALFVIVDTVLVVFWLKRTKKI